MKPFIKPLLILMLCLAGTLSRASETLFVSQWLPKSHPLYQVMEQWQRDVSAATEGELSFNVLPQAVAAPADHYNAIRDGLADISIAVLGYTPGRFPLTKLVEMPFMTHTAESNSVAFYRLAARTPAMMKEFRDVKVLALFTHGPGVVFNTRKPVRTVADLKGLKFRVGGGVVNQVAQALGANASLKPATESYELLANGVMDGVWLPFESLYTYNLQGLIKHATSFPGGLYTSTFIIMMNKSRWQELNEAQQQAVQELSGETYSRELGQAFDRMDRDARIKAEKAGIRVIDAPEPLVKSVRDGVKPLLDEWKEVAVDKGIEDPDAVIERYREDIAQ
ncbi:MAG: TRAP transporter substrate-binding protein [Alcanivorax sp.]|nr:TRAP transporter substrate-binding protein [Alcanivorax sp.]